jgi:hypothetical protein
MAVDARVPRVCIAFASKICSARAAATQMGWVNFRLLVEPGDANFRDFRVNFKGIATRE